jgi:hypothetical protein
MRMQIRMQHTPLDDGLHRAVDIFMSGDARDVKTRALAGALRCEHAVVAAFLARWRTLDELLAFVAVHHPDRPTLPLHVLVHIRHLRHNPLLQENTVLPIECGAPCEPWVHRLPDELRYVLFRLPNDAFPYETPSGVTLVEAPRRRSVESAYRDVCSSSVWGRGAAKIVAECYMGMGYFAVLAFLPEPQVFFRFVEGGANDYDREDNFQAASVLTEITVESTSWRSFFENRGG